MSAGLVYDYAIIGAGAAGLQLALALSEDAFFREKKIVLLEAGEKINNDRTWSFWEKGAGKFDSVVYRKWERAAFINDGIYCSVFLIVYNLVIAWVLVHAGKKGNFTFGGRFRVSGAQVYNAIHGRRAV